MKNANPNEINTAYSILFRNGFLDTTTNELKASIELNMSVRYPHMIAAKEASSFFIIFCVNFC